MNYLSQLFPWLNPQGQITAIGGTRYCLECITNSGVPGAKFCPGCACREGYGCSGGAIQIRSAGSRFSGYTQQQLNDMAANITMLQKQYDDAVNDYSSKKAAYDSVYATFGNCSCPGSCSSPCTCQPGNVQRMAWDVDSSCTGTRSDTLRPSGRERVTQARTLADTAEAAMNNKKAVWEQAKKDYSAALAQFEREITANMTPEQKAAYEAAKQQTADAAATAATRNKLLKWGGVTALVVVTGFALVFGGKKLFGGKAPAIVKAAA